VVSLTKDNESLKNKLATATSTLKNFDSETPKENEQFKISIATLSKKK